MNETPKEAARRLSTKAIEEGFRPEALHEYCDAKGNVLYHRIRLKDAAGQKRIRPMSLNGHGYKLCEPEFPNGKPLYRLPDLNLRSNEPAWFVEGEWAADHLARIGVLATTSGAADSARHADFSPLANRQVIVWPDNDEPGLKHAHEVVSKLKALSATVRLVDISKLKLPPKGDAVDWLKLHPNATAAEVEALPLVAYANAPSKDKGQSVPIRETADAPETFKRLAALSPLDYDRCRENEAKQLGVRVGTLDAEVSRLRPASGDGRGTGTAVLFEEPEPWSDPIDGAILLEEVAKAFTRYLVLPASAADALALWAAHTHVCTAFEHTPRINVTAPVKGCGKTLVLDVLQTLVAKGLRTENVSTAVTFRLIDAEAPTLLIDEYDSFLKDNEDLRGALNAGHKRGGRHLRCEGDKNEVRAFKTFAPVALAGIGSLPGTLADRSIIIRMERAKPGELRERFDSRKATQTLKRQLIRWAADNRRQLENCDPDLPGLYNRRADNWRPLFAIADVIGGEWPDKVRNAVTALADKNDESESAGVQLLADIRNVFSRKPIQTWLPSAEIIDELLQREDAPWQEWRKGKAITQAGVARLLKPFSIRPKQHRYEDGRAGISSYERSKFEDAFSRYLPPAEPSEQTSTPLQPAPQSHSGDFQSSTKYESVELTKTPKPAPHKACRGVELRKPGIGARAWAKPSWQIIPREPAQSWSIRI